MPWRGRFLGQIFYDLQRAYVIALEEIRCDALLVLYYHRIPPVFHGLLSNAWAARDFPHKAADPPPVSQIANDLIFARGRSMRPIVNPIPGD